MFFSVCIPAYNRAHTISRTLDSLVKQTFKDFEVVVVDDGSKDNTEDMVHNYADLLDLKYIKKENGGKHSALNVGIANAEGEFFLIVDSDDWLLDDGLNQMYGLCKKILNDDTYSGVLCRCANIETGKLIGDEIPTDYETMSYIDMHFVLRNKGVNLGDCCECNKTNILKRFRFPEKPGMKFVPEAWMFDQIGIEYKMLTSNIIVEMREYMEGGITLDKKYKIKNNIGYLYHYVSRIENILPKTNLGLAAEIITWWRNWQSVRLDSDKQGPRVKKVNVLGQLVRIGRPLIDLVYRIKYRELYESGR